MKTKWVVLLTALATCLMFTLFAYCTKDGTEPAEGLTTTESTIDLTGTTWRAYIPQNPFGVTGTVYADFTSTNAGKYRISIYGSTFQRDFTYSITGYHGTVTYNASEDEDGTLIIFLIDNAVLTIIDSNNIGIGGRVFTRQ